MSAKPLRNTAAVHMARGSDLIMRGSPWRRDFAVLDEDGRTVLSAAPRTSPMSPRQHDYAVQQSIPGTLNLTEMIAIVQDMADGEEVRRRRAGRDLDRRGSGRLTASSRDRGAGGRQTIGPGTSRRVAQDSADRASGIGRGR